MASSPPASPAPFTQRPMSAFMRPATRNSGILSPNGTKTLGGGGGGGSSGGSRASDEDGKTSVRVAVRIRPPLRATDPGYELIPLRFQRSMVQVTSPTSLAVDSPQGRKLFVFDRVFGEDVNQEGIWEYLVESVNSFVQGYNVSMLAYGQSGAGKSYTMGTSGPAEQSDLDVMGVIPRAASALFEKLDGPRPTNNRSSMSHLRTPMRYSGSMPQVGKSGEKNWTLKATYVEIYNEQLRDLLLPEHTPQHERSVVSIREDIKGHILLTGLHAVDITSVDDLLAALNFGSMIRQTDSTAINAKSSRSHAVFSLNLIQRKRGAMSAAEKRLSVPLEVLTGNENWITTDSKLHFVDLAGSERLKNTGAQGERAKEGISINAGLASLGKVISQLSSRSASSHISYRDSKLTRLLQDSLGGNAITYMIACVTPAEFHLSETLNTVQYAQRARAIQSKPQIQQLADEGDKQALIDRLKAEVAFLREQIRSNDRGAGRVHGSLSERPERSNDREIELQNQLLDTQENYNALSQRHARLISEMTKARDGEVAENMAMAETLGESATERLKRSNSFAVAVEQVVLEYEKTIQSLEQSLSSTRGSLSSTETSLLEKETKYAYIETVNQQLQARLTKLMDRESSTENYLHDLEAKLDGHTSGEEKHLAMVMELRKEIARVRENEASCEDYISTLEERLAEADSDSELMQREIDRLEHVVQRQRSLGKLDNLLYELDHIQQDPQSPIQHVNGNKGRDRKRSMILRRDAKDVIHEHDESLDDIENPLPVRGTEADGPVDDGEPIELEDGGERSLKLPGSPDYPPQSPAQSKFVADKLENVTLELFDLRVEHEATINEFDLLSAKYEEALRTLAELQDAVDEARHPTGRDSLISASSSQLHVRPVSFLADTRVSELREAGGQYSTSRSLSSELSSAGESHNPTEHSDAEAAAKKLQPVDVRNGVHSDDKRREAEMEKWRLFAAQKEQAHAILAEKYEQLHGEHQNTLNVVQDLKSEVSKARLMESTSPRSASPLIRRKTSQNVMGMDRAHRSFAALKNIAAENFDDEPDVMANFELNLNGAMHELHSRSERIQELEADIAAAKKEVESKRTIISGLTRERSSVKISSPIDMSVVSTLHGQLAQNESQMRMLEETYQARETELLSQIEELRTALDSYKHAQVHDVKSIETNGATTPDRMIADLEAQLNGFESRHQSVALSGKEPEIQHLATTADLARRESSKPNGAALVGGGLLAGGAVVATVAAFTNHSDAPHKEAVESLQRENDGYKAIIATHSGRVAELEKAHAATQAQLVESQKSKEVASDAVQIHRDLVAQLEKQIAGHEDAIKAHKDGFSQLQTSHAKEVAEVKLNSAANYEAQLADLTSKHQASVTAIQKELDSARGDLTKLAAKVAAAFGVDASVEKLDERISALLNDQKALAEAKKFNNEQEQTVNDLVQTNNTVLQELETVRSEIAALVSGSADGAKLKDEHTSISDQLAVLKKEMTELESKNKKNSRLVEELEDQLASNFDQHQIANNRLSSLQTERNAQLEEANTAFTRAQSDLAAIKEEYASLRAKYDDIQADPTGARRSNSTNLRKSASVASLPSPPPAVPLPPLPPIVGGSVSPSNTNAATVSPPPTGRPMSKDVANTQIQEDQEARIRTIEKHLFAEKQLTTTLEEALTDLERQSHKVKADCDAWRRRAMDLDQELKELRDRPQQENRWSVHQVEEERKKRKDAEIARAHLEERMNAINKKKKKGASLNCF